ncbi:MAG TPA: hypothetical protein PK521_09420 [Bacteroidales bacterium]|jgi:hypothetical protein|nr:hypothetical protein [Bacteroidales bacterium]HOX75925.1 hypothetical protein [Bacteroidales bacterium]HQM69513.1 hypothetical protein [Bacteroidales bacterium]
MKVQVNKILILLLVLVSLAGCRKNFTLSDDQEVLFQYEYRNHAWGKQHSGYFIDKKGNILIYNNPEEWNNPDNDLMIYQDKLHENLDRCTISDKIIPLYELEKFTRHIPNISSSKVSAVRNTGADMGSHKFICYKFDETFHVYKGYLIKMEGDNTCENLNFYSKKIVSWMKEIIDTGSPK